MFCFHDGFIKYSIVLVAKHVFDTTSHIFKTRIYDFSILPADIFWRTSNRSSLPKKKINMSQKIEMRCLSHIYWVGNFKLWENWTWWEQNSSRQFRLPGSHNAFMVCEPDLPATQTWLWISQKSPWIDFIHSTKIQTQLFQEFLDKNQRRGVQPSLE